MEQEPAEVQAVEVSSIIRDERFQMRGEIDQRLVNKYATILRNGGSLPPITVAKIGAAYWLVDGFHRLAAEEKQHQKAKVREEWQKQGSRWKKTERPPMMTQAVVIGGNITVRKALQLAALANLAHGAPLKTADLFKVFCTYVNTGMHRTRKGCKSYRVMAVELGAQRSYETVRSWMKKEYPLIAKQMSGEEYSTHKPRTAERREDWTDEVLRHMANIQAHCKGNQDDRHGLERIQSALDELSQALQEAKKWRPIPAEEYRSPEF